MTQSYSTPSQRLETLGRRPTLPLAANLAVGVAVALVNWDCRRRSRRALAKLSPDQLRDIGVTPAEAGWESSKPFWQV
ncbi:DUF1127 domain-containing protein [Tropicimonas sp. TH_r6]|uniref:DUF1127 domain-containing protein n=1 Tax=Tropicimonas sp. TH_r6 TaxID=3082085 RepID=UPI002955A280|nr:DUF1127 domain-containing protein [Tropicimonas sp. TH_r6]MDV7143945.1 DUF1127 domain-containing protein [Tropicimonas sp. TH_r6]